MAMMEVPTTAVLAPGARPNTAVGDPAHGNAAAIPPASATCEDCGRTFDTVVACHSHRAKAHGYRHPARCLMLSVHCPVCLRMFWTRGRGYHHLRRTHRCLQLATKHIEPLTAEECRAADADNTEIQRLNIQRASLGDGRIHA